MNSTYEIRFSTGSSRVEAGLTSREMKRARPEVRPLTLVRGAAASANAAAPLASLTEC
jgi:hypothetical protein